MEPADVILQTILSRRSVSPKRLIAPGPDKDQIMLMVKAAACAPDPQSLRPWRFVLFPAQTREALSDLFEQALLERLPQADEDARTRARAKGGRGPVLLGLIMRLGAGTADPSHYGMERVLADDQYASGGAALQNILLMAHSMGFAARATSGRAIRSQTFRNALKLAENEQFLCFVSIGTAADPKPAKPRPDHEDLFSEWQAA